MKMIMWKLFGLPSPPLRRRHPLAREWVRAGFFFAGDPSRGLANSAAEKKKPEIPLPFISSQTAAVFTSVAVAKRWNCAKKQNCKICRRRYNSVHFFLRIFQCQYSRADLYNLSHPPPFFSWPWWRWVVIGAEKEIFFSPRDNDTIFRPRRQKRRKGLLLLSLRQPETIQLMYSWQRDESVEKEREREWESGVSLSMKEKVQSLQGHSNVQQKVRLRKSFLART